MEYNYSFTSSGIINVEVDPQWVDIMEGLDRAEHANDEYNRRLYIKLSRGTQHEPDPCEIVCSAESMMELMKKLENLTDRQREVLAKRMQGMAIRAIAREEGKYVRAIEKTLEQIQKKSRRRVVKPHDFCAISERHNTEPFDRRGRAAQLVSSPSERKLHDENHYPAHRSTCRRFG
ncbi:hypothetical protein AGMMS49992_23880 [Clostridia bacterium]|nr:hypothetical protein AGMMS49992_23880 [Clostridia bacterium]